MVLSPKAAQGPTIMIPQFPSASSLTHIRAQSSVSVLDESHARIKAISFACRLVQMVLALYLIPAFLIVSLVGAVGMLTIGSIRLCIRLLDATDR